MKRLLWIALAASSLAACKKDKVGVSANVIGKWELHRRYGGNIIPPDTTYQPGNGNILQFNADSTYKTYSAGTVTDAGTFHILRNAYKSDNTFYDELYFNDNSYNTFGDAVILDIVTTTGTILTIKPLMPDVGTTQYSKISN